MFRIHQAWLLIAVICACDPQVKIGVGFDGGSQAPDAGSISAAGGGEAAGGGAATGGGTATGGGNSGTDAGLNGLGCPNGLQCEDVSGKGDFGCMDPTTSGGIPQNAAVCANTAPCAAGFTCYLRSASSSVGACIRDCPNSETDGGVNHEPEPELIPPPFVSASPPQLLTRGSTLALPFPEPRLTGDFLIALVDADEGDGPRTLSLPPGWALLSGWPIHNRSTDHSPYIIPALQNHGTWIFTHFAVANEPALVEFLFSSDTTARATIVAYRGVDSLKPVHDKVGYGLYGDGDTNGYGSGNTTLDVGRQVSLFATAATPDVTYSITSQTSGVVERVNSGEQPYGLNVIIVDDEIYPRSFFPRHVRHFQAPSASSSSFMFSIASLVLTPRSPSH